MTELEILKKENEAQKIKLANLEKQLEEFRQAYETLRHQTLELIRHRFGRRSERYVDPENKQIDILADELAIAQQQAANCEEETTEVPSHKRRKRTKKDTSNLPRDIVIIPVADEDKQCSCGCKKRVIRYETKEMYHCKPAEYCIKEQRREVVACPNGCEHSIQTAPAPLHILPKTKATEELLSHIAVSKLHDRQPLYHLEKYISNIGISRETMARWMIQLVPHFQPLLNLMKEQQIEYDIGSLDATTLQVLKEPGRPATKKSYLYCMRGGPPDKSSILYAYNAQAHKEFVDNWYMDFKGSLHMDADPFFELLLKDANVNAACCNAHARRKFESVAKQAKKPGLAKEALYYYKELYKIERQAKNEKMTPQERYELRHEYSKPIIEKFEAWLKTNHPLVLPASPLGKAFQYTLNHWKELTHYLADGRLEIDNNLTEQEIKPVVIARKNFMFADSVDGAHALCAHFSLIRTALLHMLRPYDYYVVLLKSLPHCKNLEDYERLLPWNIKDSTLNNN